MEGEWEREREREGKEERKGVSERDEGRVKSERV